MSRLHKFQIPHAVVLLVVGYTKLSPNSFCNLQGTTRNDNFLSKAVDEMYRSNVIRHWNERRWRTLSFERHPALEQKLLTRSIGWTSSGPGTKAVGEMYRCPYPPSHEIFSHSWYLTAVCISRVIPNNLVYLRISRPELSRGAKNVSTFWTIPSRTPQLSQNECKQNGFIPPQTM